MVCDDDAAHVAVGAGTGAAGAGAEVSSACMHAAADPSLHGCWRSGGADP